MQYTVEKDITVRVYVEVEAESFDDAYKKAWDMKVDLTKQWKDDMLNILEMSQSYGWSEDGERYYYDEYNY